MVRDFWLSPTVSRPMPLKKQVLKHNMPTHLLECSYTDAFKFNRFKKENPQIKVGYVKFIQLKPKNVRHMRVDERIVCCCTRCENIKLKLKALNTVSVAHGVPKICDEHALSDLT